MPGHAGDLKNTWGMTSCDVMTSLGGITYCTTIRVLNTQPHWRPDTYMRGDAILWCHVTLNDVMISLDGIKNITTVWVLNAWPCWRPETYVRIDVMCHYMMSWRHRATSQTAQRSCARPCLRPVTRMRSDIMLWWDPIESLTPQAIYPQK